LEEEMTKKKRVARILPVLAILMVVLPARAQEPPDSREAALTADTVKEAAEGVGLSDAVIDKLEPELLYDLVRYKIHADSMGQESEVAAWAVPLFMFGFTFLIIGAIFLFRFRKDREKHTTLRLMVEKGVEIPSRLLDPPAKLSDVRKGILLLSVGMGFSLMMLLICIWEPEAIKGAPVGVVPGLIGLGYLLLHKLDKKKAQ
jgi:hypothetical protein